MTHNSITSILILLALAATLSQGHMQMSVPPPRQARDNPGPNGQVDFNLNAPLNIPFGGSFPCKGHPAQAPVLTVVAGESIPITLTGGAPHDGGHCQFALSYDGDQTFVVVDTIIRECMRRQVPFSTRVTIPQNAPSGRATFAWSWINAIGGIEYYMNCADIEITGGSGPTGSLSGPELLVANLPGTVQFPSFPGDSPDRRELFDQRPTITVRGNRGQALPPVARGSNISATTKPALAVTVTATPTTPPLIATPPAANPTLGMPGTGQQTGDACGLGQIICGPDGKTYRVCVNGKFMDFPVGNGTKCLAGPNGTGIQFGLVCEECMTQTK